MHAVAVGVNLSGARILVTGASGALGGRIARKLCDDGSRLCVSGRNGERLRAIAAELDASSMPGDLREVGAAMDIVDAAVERLGGLDGVVHAAGVVALAARSMLWRKHDRAHRDLRVSRCGSSGPSCRRGC